MVDRLTTARRSWNMSRIRRQDTQPELVVRRALHRLGYRFRLHRRDLPGTPDVVLPKLRVVIFVNGCFWHRHIDCRLAATPTSNSAFWLDKFERNVARDKAAIEALSSLNWRTLTVWECETRDPNLLDRLIRAFMN